DQGRLNGYLMNEWIAGDNDLFENHPILDHSQRVTHSGRDGRTQRGLVRKYRVAVAPTRELRVDHWSVRTVGLHHRAGIAHPLNDAGHTQLFRVYHGGGSSNRGVGRAEILARSVIIAPAHRGSVGTLRDEIFPEANGAKHAGADFD